MANELQAYIETGKTIYAVLMNSAGQIWNGAAFEAINGSNWTDYDISLSESTAGIYLANLPAVTAGIYAYIVYEQAGGSPAITDGKLGVGYLNWDGSAILPLSTVDTVVDSILADTNELQTDNIPTTLSGIESKIDTVDTNVDDIETAVGALNDLTAQQVWEYATRTLTDPNSYKADVSSLALEATLSAIKGAGWTTETLVAISDAIDALDFSELTAQQVWEYATRALSTPADYKADVSTLETRLSADRAGYLDKLNVSGTLAHSDAAATYKADVSALALEATLTAIKGAGWTTETLKAIADAVDSLNDPTPQQVWEYATRTLTDPDSYKADVSGLALEATLTAMKGAGWTDETLVSLMTAIESGTVDEATIRSAVGLASANLDTQLSGIQTDLDNPSQYKADVSGLAPAGEYDTELDATISSRAPADEYDTELTNLQADITTILTDYARRTGDYAPADEYDTELTNLAADITTIVTDYARRTGDYAPASEYDTELTAIQADLDNPDQYKADISALALEATLTAIKGSGWTDETLKAIKDAIDGISVDGASAEEVWEYVSRTLTQSATEVTAAVSGSSITQIRGNSWSIEITGVTLDSNKQQFMLKKSSGSSDDNAVLFIDSETGLLTVNGVTATDATKASLSYVGTTLTVTVDASITAQLPAETLDYGIQSVTAAGAVSELYSGDFVITADIVRATE